MDYERKWKVFEMEVYLNLSISEWKEEFLMDSFAQNTQNTPNRNPRVNSLNKMFLNGF